MNASPLSTLKTQMITLLLTVEQGQIGTARKQAMGIAIGSPEYYGLFRPMYESDPLFAKAIGQLCDPCDEIYAEFRDAFAKLYHFTSERIAIHSIRLCLYFRIDTALCAPRLKSILFAAIAGQEATEFVRADSAARVFGAGYDLLRASLASPDAPNAFTDLDGGSVRELFGEFITEDEVTDSATAMVFELCHRRACPAYIAKVVKALNVYDRLYGIGWQTFVGKHSAKSTQTALQLLCELGFEELVALLRQAMAYRMDHPGAKAFPPRMAKAMDLLITPEYWASTVSAYIAACKIDQ